MGEDSGIDRDYIKEFKKLDLYMRDLREMQSELLPGESKNRDDMKGLDKFGQQKMTLNQKLKEVREGVDHLDELKKGLAPGERDNEVIKQMTTNAKHLKEVTAMWTELKQILVNDEKKKKKLEKKTLEDRQKIVKTLGKEILDLTNRNSRVASSGPATDADVARLGGEKDKKSNKKREERRAKREKRKKGGRGDEDEMDDLPTSSAPPQPMSAQEQAFMDARDQAYEEQDKLLEEIAKGLDELVEIGEDMNKNLQVQQNMLEEVGDKMDKNIAALESVNHRLKNILEESGGLSRWIPLVICSLLLLALLGYIYSIAK